MYEKHLLHGGGERNPYEEHCACSGVDLHALEHDKDHGLPSDALANDDHNTASGWVPDWTRSALDEVFGPLAETAILLHMSSGQATGPDAEADVGGK